MLMINTEFLQVQNLFGQGAEAGFVVLVGNPWDNLYGHR